MPIEMLRFKLAYRSAISSYIRYSRGIDDGDERSLIVKAFLSLGLSEIDNSFSFLLQGRYRPAGNAIRCYCEAIGMALLVSSRKLDCWEQLKGNIKNSNGDIAISRLSDSATRRKSGIDEDFLVSITEVAKFHNQYSHSSLLNVQYLLAHGMHYINGAFDSGRIADYKHLLVEGIKHCKILSQVIGICCKEGKAIKNDSTSSP